MNEPVKIQTPPQEMSTCDIEFAFTRLNTKTWQEIRLLLQRRADIFLYNPDKTVAYAGFKITPQNMKKVLDIYLRVSHLKTVFVKVKGTNIETPGEMYSWGSCWIESHATKDKELYCTVRNWDPWLYTNETDWRDYLNRRSDVEMRLTLPCKCAWFKPDLDKPGTLFEQYMDAARTKGCDKCPLFNAKLFNIRPLDSEEKTAKQVQQEWQKMMANPIEYIRKQIEEDE